MKRSQLKRAVGVALSIMMMLAFLPAPTLADPGDPSLTESFTVTFSIDGTIDVGLTQTVEAGGTASNPGTPAVPEGAEYEGMRFLYWYATEGWAYDFATPVTADLALNAAFGYTEETEDPAAEETGSAVSIYIYGGSDYTNLIQHYVMADVTDEKILEYDGTEGVDLLHLLQADTGYALAGTGTAIPAGDLHNAEGIDLEGGSGTYSVSVSIAAGTVSAPCTVHYENMHGDAISPDKTLTGLSVGDLVTEDAPDIEGYTLDSTSPRTVVLAYSGNDITFEYTPTVYHITYILNDGENDLSNPATYTVESGPITLADPTREECDFLGWKPGDNIPSGSTGDRTFTATWSGTTALTLTANSATYDYDGVLKSVSGITPSIEGLTVEGTTAGASSIVPGEFTTSFSDQESLVILSGGEDITDQYEVSWADGTLTINPRVIYRVDVSDELIGVEWVDYGTGDATYGVSPAESVSYGGITYYWLGTYDPATATDLTENTTIYAQYALTKPKLLVITADSGSCSYDGDFHTVTTASISDTDVTVSGYTLTGGGTDAGTYPVSVVIGDDFMIMSGETDVTDQYGVSTVDGTLTILPANTMAVTADDYSDIYDGDAHGVAAGVEVDGTTTIFYGESESDEPADYTLSESPTLTHTGSKTVYFVALNGNYEPAFGSAQITILPRSITIETNSASKVYDGAPLTEIGWVFGAASDGFAEGEGFDTASTNGTVTNAGSVDNGFTYTLGSAAQSGDYTLSVLPGTLTVTKRAVLVLALDASKNYGDSDPAFAYAFMNGTLGGTAYYPVVAADLALVAISVQRTNSDNLVGLYPDVLVPSIVAAPAALNNYVFSAASADFMIDPRVTYIVNTAATVTGFPQPEWFGYGTDAVVADSAGVTRAGYVLSGWRDASTNESIALGGTIPSIARNYALNAVWVRASYSLTYATGTTAPVLYMPANQTGFYAGDTVTISGGIPSCSGYEFLHWSTDDIDGTETTLDPGDSFDMPRSSVKLTAVWQATTSPVYYHPNGASGITFEEGRYATDSEITIAENTFTREGYRFIGWSETTPTADVTRQPGDVVTMLPRRMDFYAQWEEEEALFYTVTYIVSGGTGDLDGGAYMTYTGLSIGDALPVPGDPELDGYTFEGWSGEIPATMPGEDVVIYGMMTRVQMPQPVAEESGDITEEIPDTATPLAGGPAWTLVNLVIAIATALVSIWMLLGLIGRKKDVEDGVVTPETQRRQGIARGLTLLPGIGGIIMFLLTENMNNPMGLTDHWTIYMVAIALVQFLLFAIGTSKAKNKDQDQDKRKKNVRADNYEKPWTYDVLKGV